MLIFFKQSILDRFRKKRSTLAKAHNRQSDGAGRKNVTSRQDHRRKGKLKEQGCSTAEAKIDKRSPRLPNYEKQN